MRKAKERQKLNVFWTYTVTLFARRTSDIKKPDLTTIALASAARKPSVQLLIDRRFSVESTETPVAEKIPPGSWGKAVGVSYVSVKRILNGAGLKPRK
ncbi:hypothetical protein WR25_06276 [Diploscapter pachys]|uniref:Uncharacterized protein n=1 Tax=Diploscapter pachys TaxID=2018661 RepID=A0A2A2LXB7_9BILA|nr:hypothetical protein WR25_06276 [Diploscapter pachys]